MLIYRLHQYCGDCSEDYFYGYFKTKKAMLKRVNEIVNKELTGYYLNSVHSIVENFQTINVTYKTKDKELVFGEPFQYEIIDIDKLE